MPGESDQITIPGRFFPARSSRAVPANLFAGPRGFVIRARDDNAEIADHHGQARFDAPIGRAPRRLSLPDGALFETEDLAAVDALDSGSGGQILHRLEGFRRGWTIITILCLIGAYCIWRFALPALVYIAVWLTPAPLKTAMDAGTLQSFDLTIADASRLSIAQKDSIQGIFDDLLETLPDKDRERFTFELTFRDVPGIGPNAFALPGGTVVITDAFAQTFDDPDIIGGVLGHEIAHVVSHHGLEQLYRSLGIYVLVALVAGDTGPILNDVLLEGGVLLSLSNSREHEREADELGMRLASDAGYDPAGLLRFFETLPDAQSKGGDWFSTHPSSGKRIEAIREFIEAR